MARHSKLATGLVFTSGIVHYADKPGFFESLPAEAQRIFRDAPARWDETRCLAGEPGRLVVFARRSGGSWFIAGLNGSNGTLPITLNLSDFSAFKKRTLIAEGEDPVMQIAVSSIRAAGEFNRKLPPRGGFILRLEK